MNLENIIYITLAVILLVIVVILLKYNSLIKLQNRVKKASANIEIYLNKRFELIPNLVECVKGYSNYESDTLENIVSLRNSYNSQKNMSLEEASRFNSSLNKYLAIVENYPNLKANEQYGNLQAELSRIEDELERARKYYNDEVTRYNTQVETVPSNIVASIFAFKKAPLFQTSDEGKENINVKFN